MQRIALQPRGGWAEPQKERWAAEHFPGTRIVTCMAVDKRRHARAGDILVDDTLKYKHLWEEADGIFVHHRSARETIAALARLLPRDAQLSEKALAASS